MGIRIDTTDIQLGVDYTPSKLDIDSRIAKLEMHQEYPEVRISTEMPRVLIDQSQCFAEAGLKKNYDFTKEAAMRGYRQAMGFIGQTAEDGDALAAIERGGDPIAEIAERKAFPQKEFVLAAMPKSRPRIKATGNIAIDWRKNGNEAWNGVERRCIPSYAKINYTPSKVEIYVRRYPSVEIKQDENVDVLI